MLLPVLLLSALAALGAPQVGALPTPDEHFGHAMGEDRRLVRWEQVVGYFRRLEAASPAVQVSELGTTTEGRPMIVATIADPATIADLERYREIVARLADPRRTPRAAAEELFAAGKPVVLVTCSIHSTEVASTLTAAQFAYNLLAHDTPRHRAILEHTIFLLVPSLNPDGVDKVQAWYERWLGSPYEGAPMTELYHKYAGHDTNRDWYVFSLRETRLAVEKLHNAWRPQIVYDVHQMGTDGARIFVPPWIDPIDPNIDPLIVQQVNAFGTAMAVDLTAAGKKGVLIQGIYDYYSPARHYQSYHGGLRLLSESASARLASPITVPWEKLNRKGRNYDARAASWNFLEPWEGGEWRLRDIVENQLITFESALYAAAVRREDLLRNFYEIGRRVIERGRGQAFVIPREQHDPNAASRLLRTLRFGDVEIERALADAESAGGRIQVGDFVVRLDQPYGAFAKTLLERQNYPDLREHPRGVPREPYDATAHSLPLLMGVRVFETDSGAQILTERAEKIEFGPGQVAEADWLKLSPRFGASWIAVNRLQAEGVAVRRSRQDGFFHFEVEEAERTRFEQLAAELDLDFVAGDAAGADQPALAPPRVALYAGYVPLIDAGWTRWLLDRYGFRYESVGNAEILAGLAESFDVLILPDARPEILEDGYRHEYGDGDSIVPPEYRAGLGRPGVAALREFAASGGTILAFNRAALYAMDRLDLPVENVAEDLGKARFFAPGTLVNAKVDRTHPLCFGMREREAVWFESGPVFQVRRQALSRVRQVVRYAQREVLASGWLIGRAYLANRAAVVDVPVGRGRVLLFGIRPQYRGQSNATFKLVFNGLHL